MCTETIALCESCGFHRHMHYHLCMAWIWSFRQIKWAFTTPFDAIPKAKNCPFFDGEVKREIEPGRCPNKQCPGYKIKAELDMVATDVRTDAEKIEAQRIKMGLKKKTRPQGFRNPLEVGRPHQRKLPVVIMEGWEGSSGTSQAKQKQSSDETAAMEQEHARGIAIPSSSPAVQEPFRRLRNFNGPMMIPH
ncbi:hypothetical protein EsH8_VII_000483 [Colletotrichum jinshuiense]